MEVEVVVRGVGFDKLASDAERASAALKSMGAAVRGTSAAGSAAAKATNDMMRGVNGAAIGTKLGNQIRASMAATMGSGSFWTNAFGGLNSRFKTFGQTLGKSLSLGLQSTLGGIRSLNGGKGPNDTDLIGGALVGGLAFKGVEDLVKAAADRQNALFRLTTTGLIKPEQIGAVQDLANAWSREFGNLSGTEGVNAIRDAIQIFGGTHDLFGNDGSGTNFTPEGRAGLTHIARLMSFAKAYQATGAHGANVEEIERQFADAIRSGEIKGLGSNPKDLGDWVERLTKVSLATGVNPSTFLQAQRNAGLSFLTMDDDAIYGFATMVQENKGRAGVMRRTAFLHDVAGNNQTVRSNEMWRKLGLLGSEADIQKAAAEGRLELNKEGQIKYIDDQDLLQNSRLAGTNPYRWDAEVLYPAIRDKIRRDTGDDIGDVNKAPSARSREELVDIMRSIAKSERNPNAATEAAEAIIQYSQMQRRGQNVRKVQLNEEKANELAVKKFQDFNAQMDQLKVNLGTTLLPAVNSLLGGVNGVIQSFADDAKAHPEIAKWAVGGTLGTLGAGGAIASGMLFARIAKLPFAAIGGIIKGIATLTAGIGIGVYDLVGGAAVVGATTARISAAASWVRRLAPALKAVSNLGLAIYALDGIIGDRNLKDIGSAVRSNFTGDKKGTEAKWKSLDDRFKKWLDGIFGKNNVAWNLVRNRVYGVDTSERGAQFAQSIGKYNLPALEAWNNRLGYANEQGHPWHWQMPRTYLGRGSSAFRGGDPMNGGRLGTPVPVTITQMPKTDSRPNNVTTNVTVNVQSNASPQAIGGAVGSAVGSKVMNALSDQHHD